MSTRMVYDLPTRLFHFSFGALFLTAFGIGKFVDDENPIYAYHMTAGLTLGLAVVLRLIWGWVGTEHARFSSFALRPRDLVNYFLGILRGDKRKWAGHNPASSWVALVMFAMGLGLVFSGYNMVSGGNRDEIKEIHEVFGSVFAVLVLAHVAGIFLHTIRHKEIIGLSMVTGKKSDVPEAQQIESARVPFALLFVLILALFGTYILGSYDSTKSEMVLFGKKLVLLEKENKPENEHGSQSGNTQEDKQESKQENGKENKQEDED